MHFSPPTLHAHVLEGTDYHKAVAEHFEQIARAFALIEAPQAAAAESVMINLTTVSLNLNFDSYITIQFQSEGISSPSVSMIVDSGNSMLIIPDWDAISNLPGYTILGEAMEPWGCPAKVVKGPILIPTADGKMHTIPDCVFYACTGTNSHGQRTANFGAGRPTPWSANGWNKPSNSGGVIMQAPLSYNKTYPYAVFNFAPADTVFSADGSLKIDNSSFLTLLKSAPDGYKIFNSIPNIEWMSLIPNELSIGGALTGWPGDVASPIAMVDTGGGPVFLSDPKGHIYDKTWPHKASCPGWSSGSENCECMSGGISLILGDTSHNTTYNINTSNMPSSVQGLTLVACKENKYMMGQNGMNIGGISALFTDIIVDYSGSTVGLKTKNQPSPVSFDPNYYYRIYTMFRGKEMCLDIFNGGKYNNMPHLTERGDYSGQYWRIEAIQSPNFFRLSTMFRGDNMDLDVYNGGEYNNMLHLVPKANYTGQYWRVTATQFPGFFRLSTTFRGDDMDLDVYNGGEYNNMPHLTNGADYSGQFWYFEKTPKKVP